MVPRTVWTLGLPLALWALAAPAQDGQLDLSFDGDGRQTLGYDHPPNDDDALDHLAAQPDGRLVVAGRVCGSQFDCFVTVTRLLANGALDPSFDGDGRATLSFGSVVGGSFAAGLLVRPQDGKIVVAGHAARETDNRIYVGLARLTAAGEPDPVFGDDESPGTTAVELPNGEVSWVAALAANATGRLLVGGYGRPTGQSDGDFFVARFTETGQLDAAFGEQGVAWIGFDQGQFDTDQLVDLAVQTDGRIVAVGAISDVEENDLDTGIARLLANGTLDPTFGDDGRVVWQYTDFGGATQDFPASVVVQPDGRILVSGETHEIGGANARWYFGRRLADGAVDTSLTAVFSDLPLPLPERGGTLALQSDGKILLSGFTLDEVCVAARWDASGDDLDPTFGTGGFAVVTGAPGDDVRCRAATLAGGRLVLGGTRNLFADSDLFVARLSSSLVFRDGFGAGSTVAWSSTSP